MSRLRQRQCSATLEHGQPCGATPLRDKDLCFWHDPEMPSAQSAPPSVRALAKAMNPTKMT